jgi:predicted nucleic acid-binding protein
LSLLCEASWSGLVVHEGIKKGNSKELSYCTWIQIYYRWWLNLSDEGDNHLIELAVAGNAQFIVTYNLKDFKSMGLQFPELQIVSLKYS